LQEREKGGLPVVSTSTSPARRTLPDHDRCDTHRGYKLSCEQYERLLARSGQRCEITVCRADVRETSQRKLSIDHSGPWWAVRGLLCTRCNTRLKDGRGWFEGGPEYLANTWWIQECRRVGMPTQLAPEPAIGAAIRDQHGIAWIHETDGLWHAHGRTRPGASRLTWERIYDMRGPHNMAPFDVHGPDGSELLRWRVEKALRVVAAQEREAAAYQRGRLEFARELLDSVTAEERDHFLDQVDYSDDRDWLGDDYEPQTETGIACSAVDAMLNSVRCDWYYLTGKVEESLRDLPDGIGERAALAIDRKPPPSLGGPYARTFALTDALHVADDLLALPAAREYLSAMQEAERGEWMTFARNLYNRAELDEDRLTARAAHCAQVVLDNRRWDDMCSAPGTSIPSCPQRATHRARLAEANCCGPDSPPDHKGHPVCDDHLAELVEGTSVGRSGKTFSTVDYEPIGSPAWDF
jgi:hypothetical protein